MVCTYREEGIPITYNTDKPSGHYVKCNKLITKRQGKEMKKVKMVVWGGLTNSCARREVKGKGEKERYTHLNAEFQE